MPGVALGPKPLAGRALAGIAILVLLLSLLVPGASAQPGPIERVHLIPLGDVFELDYDGLVDHYQQRFGIPIQVEDPLPLTGRDIDWGRGQVVAEQLIESMRAGYPSLDGDPAALLIGITEYDMYIRDVPDWRWAFSLRTGGRFVVISSARMDPANYLLDPDPELLHLRLRKMITKSLGLLYFRLPLSDDPTSVLYHSILGLEDLDAVGEDF